MNVIAFVVDFSPLPNLLDYSSAHHKHRALWNVWDTEEAKTYSFFFFFFLAVTFRGMCRVKKNQQKLSLWITLYSVYINKVNL